MKVITKQDRINNVAERWKQQYGNRKKDIYKKLDALNNATEQQIADIIGNKAWTINRCTECEQDSSIIVEVGEEPDYESQTAYCLCLTCLQKAICLAKTKKARMRI